MLSRMDANLSLCIRNPVRFPAPPGAGTNVGLAGEQLHFLFPLSIRKLVII